MPLRLSDKDKRSFIKSLGKNVATTFLDLIPKLNLVGQVDFTIGAEAANAISVTIQVKNENGDNLAEKVAMRVYLSSDSAGLTPAAATSAIAAGASGAVLDPTTITAEVVTTAAGLAILSLTDTGTPTRYLNVVLPSGEIVTSSAITWA
jgi:hypothetical protein